MEIAPLRAAELESFVDELWVPAQREMATTMEYSLADGLREKGLSYKRSQLDKDDAVTYLARREDTPIGYVAADVETPPPIVEQLHQCHISELYVIEDARRQGVAAELLSTVEEWGRDCDCQQLTLQVAAENHAAIELYETAGYSIKRHEMTKPIEST
ncbi:GNAT family N-acetyltransferase [Halorarius halobius]|uniref:GNAT family N-acetyltransferase n=1 Tax=Halorarius halobius TaxID=2962671 RepID=UPI0020CDB98C|nr:GNAT family N-acetyltransferase [Halorarius halobius]